MKGIDYKPPGPVLRAFLRSGAFVRGIRGPIGSGKSTACCIEIVRRAGQQAPGPDGIRHSRWAVIRNTQPELKTTTIKTWLQWMPQSIGQWREQGPPSHRITQDGIDIEVLFVALDRPEDVRKLLSMELTGAWINEAREIPKAVLDGLTGRVGRYPSAKDGGAAWAGVILDTNAPDTDHWWYRLAEELRPAGYEFFSQPAGDGPEAENIANLPAGYYDRAKAGKDDNWIKVYVRGEYGFVQDGKPVFPEYRDGMHCREVAPVPNLAVFVGLDFGLTPAAVFAQRMLTGQWRMLSEIVAEDMGIKRFAELLGAEMRGRYAGFGFEVFGDPAGDSRAQTDEVTPFEILRAAGIPARPAPTNDIVQRREVVASALNRLVDGEPGFIVSPRCRVLRKGLAGGYRYRRQAVTGEERYRDVPDKNAFSHVADAAQYLMLGAGEGRALIKRPEDHRVRPERADSEYNPFQW
ncbi:MAG: TerL [Alphaproteobacteria bacterium]